MTPSSMC